MSRSAPECNGLKRAAKVVTIVGILFGLLATTIGAAVYGGGLASHVETCKQSWTAQETLNLQLAETLSAMQADLRWIKQDRLARRSIR
jgi:hypothetical protein